MKPASVDDNNPYRAPRTKPQLTYGDDRPRGIVWLLFSLRGRIGRLQYWMGSLAAMLVMFVPFPVLAILAEEGSLGSWAESGPAMSGILYAYLMIFIPWSWMALALSVKRWHDRGKSGWWTLINFVPYIGGIWSFVECGLLQGTHGDNRFGPDPVGALGPFGG